MISPGKTRREEEMAGAGEEEEYGAMSGKQQNRDSGGWKTNFSYQTRITRRMNVNKETEGEKNWVS